MRNAANRELLEENFQQCEHDYETALWMLYAIADDVIQKDNPFADQDRKTIGNCEYLVGFLMCLSSYLNHHRPQSSRRRNYA